MTSACLASQFHTELGTAQPQLVLFFNTLDYKLYTLRILNTATAVDHSLQCLAASYSNEQSKTLCFSI